MNSMIFVSLFQYFNALLLIAFVVALAVVSEKMYFKVFAAFRRKSGAAERTGVSLTGWFRAPVILPASARAGTALFCPALALAALLTIFACLPICTYIPVIDNGADIVQLVQFVLLSEVFVLVSLYAAGTEEALKIARAEMRGMIRFLIPFMAACASVAAYLIKNGLDTDPFSFNSFSLFGQMRSMSWWGVAGVALFLISVLSQTPQRGTYSGTLLLSVGELPDYSGAPRGILQIWSVLRSFIIVAVVTYIVFPSEFMSTFGDQAAIAWSWQAINFLIFWLSVAAMRLIAVPLCRALFAAIEKPLPKYARGGVVYVLTVAAVLMLWYEGILLSLEAAAF